MVEEPESHLRSVARGCHWAMHFRLACLDPRLGQPVRIEERMKTVLLCWLLVAGAVLACEVPVFRLLLLGNRFSSPEFMELQEPG
jgi:hypothetical protein